MTTYGVYRFYSLGSGITHKPNANNEAGIIQVLPGCDSGWRRQKLVTISGQVYERSFATNSPDADNWVRCDNFGCNTAADLASLLGVNGQLKNNVSFDSLTHNGNWYVIAHPDSPTSGTGILVCKFASDIYGYQMFKASTATYIRHYFGGWAEEWQRLDNFGCNTAADLASLLGDVEDYGSTLVNIDLDTIISECKALYAGGSGVTHKPENNTNEFVLTCEKVSKGFNSPRIVQRAYYQNGHSYQRFSTVANGTPTWEDWSRLDNFGCASAGDLASLLGGFQNFGDVKSGNVDTYNKLINYVAVMYGSEAQGTVTNLPGNSIYFFVNIAIGNNYNIQLAATHGSGVSFIRCMEGSIAEPWRQITNV